MGGRTRHSIALIGFGLDSVIECAARGVLLWRLGMERRGAVPAILESSERRAHRFVGGTFLALAIYVLAQGGLTLWRREAPEESLIGIALAVTDRDASHLVEQVSCGERTGKPCLASRGQGDAGLLLSLVHAASRPGGQRDGRMVVG